MDRGKVTALILLDFCATFDSIDHTLVIGFMSLWYGVSHTVLQWFASYLTMIKNIENSIFQCTTYFLEGNYRPVSLTCVCCKLLEHIIYSHVMRVVVEGSYSNFLHVDSGIPQGTVLGPLLLLCHINDLPLSVDLKLDYSLMIV